LSGIAVVSMLSRAIPDVEILRRGEFEEIGYA